MSDNHDYTDNKNLDVNKKNSEEFSKLMDDASVKYDSYWDKNNWFVRILLIILFVFIVVVGGYYIVSWYISK